MPPTQNQPEYTKDQLWKLYDKLPPELQEAIFSSENAEHIDSICQRYAIEEKKIPEIAKYVGRVFLGLLPPENFEITLEKTVGLKKDVAAQVAHELNRFVMAPVNDVLFQLYHPAAPPTAGKTPAEATPAPIPQENSVEKKIPSAAGENEAPAAPAKKEKGAADSYREPIE